jgi:hypothetical protein
MIDEYGNEIDTSKIFIPLDIFADRRLSSLEVIVEYLKEKRHLTFHKIAVMLNRDDRTIWTTYNRAKNKRKKR